MADKGKGSKKSEKKQQEKKQKEREKKAMKKIVVDGIRSSLGTKKIINPKRHKNSHTKGTRKGT